jgi:hypothetical protein
MLAIIIYHKFKFNWASLKFLFLSMFIIIIISRNFKFSSIPWRLLFSRMLVVIISHNFTFSEIFCQSCFSGYSSVSSFAISHSVKSFEIIVSIISHNFRFYQVCWKLLLFSMLVTIISHNFTFSKTSLQSSFSGCLSVSYFTISHLVKSLEIFVFIIVHNFKFCQISWRRLFLLIGVIVSDSFKFS